MAATIKKPAASHVEAGKQSGIHTETTPGSAPGGGSMLARTASAIILSTATASAGMSLTAPSKVHPQVITAESPCALSQFMQSHTDLRKIALRYQLLFALHENGNFAPAKAVALDDKPVYVWVIFTDDDPPVCYQLVYMLNEKNVYEWRLEPIEGDPQLPADAGVFILA